MKTSRFNITLLAFVLAAAISINLSHAQTTASPVSASNISQPTLPAPTPYTVVSRDAHSAIWERTAYEVSPSGQVLPRKRSYTELATGLNFKNPQTGQWTPSKEEISILPNGTAAAINGQHQVYFPGDIAQGVIEIDTPEGLKLQSRPIALSYDDGSQTVLIAILTNSVGYLVGSNQVIYPDAFTGLRADLLYTYTKAGFEQNVIVQEQPPAPADFNLNPSTTRLQVLTEFFDPPQPTVSRATVPAATGNLTDEHLDFGVMKMVPGKAFLLETNSSTAPVTKQWLNVDGRQLLVEEVPIVSIADELSQLPPTSSTKITPNSPLHVVSAKRLLPAQPLAKTGNKMPVMSKATPPNQGLVIDYQTVNGSLTNYTFHGDTTYYISGAVYLNGTNTFEGGAVIKYNYNASINLMYCFTGLSVINWLSTEYHPVIFTSRHDNSVGEIISDSLGIGPPIKFANPVLSYSWGVPSVVTLGHFRMANFKTGVTFSGCNKVIISDAQFVNGNCAINVSDVGSPLAIQNASFANLTTAIQLWEAFVVGENLSFAGITSLATPSDPYSAWLYLTNCILANVTNLYSSPPYLFTGSHNGFYKSPVFGDNKITNEFYPFQTVGGGSFYLTNGCSFLNAGTNNIDPALLAELATKTTYPPIVYSNTNISNSMSLAPQAPRDTNAAPSLGYHYDPLDYITDNLVLTNAQLTITGGTVIACYNRPGIVLQDGSSIVSVGTPLAPDWFVRYQSVQEQYGFLGGTNFSSGQNVSAAPVGSTGPNGMFQFSHFATLAAGGWNFYHRSNSVFCNLTLQNDELWGGANDLSGSTNATSVTLNNNLFWRSSLFASNTSAQASLFMTNNLFWGPPSVTLVQPNSGLWSAFNNDFDTCTITNSTLTNGYNAYLNCSGRLYPTNAQDIVSASTLSYQSSWLGNFYQPAGSLLINMGSTTADQVGLYHFTTQTNQVPETNSIVDIGYHYVAVNANGNPLDTDGDGIPDYLEDANGDGLFDSGDLSDWQAYNSTNSLTGGNGLIVFTPLK